MWPACSSSARTMPARLPNRDAVRRGSAAVAVDARTAAPAELERASALRLGAHLVEVVLPAAGLVDDGQMCASPPPAGRALSGTRMTMPSIAQRPQLLS